MKPGIYVDPAQNYEWAAEFVALEYGTCDAKFTPMILRGLCIGIIPSETMDDIEADPHAFCRRVSEYCYGFAMNRDNMEAIC
jgi:hypothetical protein